MGNFIFGAVTATVLSYAYVMFGWSLPAVVELPNMIGALPEKIALIELVDDPALTDEQRQRAVALRIRSEPAIFLAYEKATNGAFTKHVLREQGCNRVWKKCLFKCNNNEFTISKQSRHAPLDSG